jgi:hypothetical protein
MQSFDGAGTHGLADIRLSPGCSHDLNFDNLVADANDAGCTHLILSECKRAEGPEFFRALGDLQRDVSVSSGSPPMR